jgi:uncharacterized protein (DUF2236 family)
MTVSPPRTPATGGLRARLLTALSGDPNGSPAWILALAEGDDRGYFVEDGPAWTVHAGTATFVAGIRALLLQALHPGPMAGVHDWSRYREDPLGRLSGTVRWIICVTYGSRAQADAETDRVRRLHTRVKGTYADAATGAERPYTASDAGLSDWVHVAFTDAFLTAQQTWGTPIPGGPDAYVQDWAQAGHLMGVAEPPLTAAELRERRDAYLHSGALVGDERARDVVRFLRKPPFPGAMGLAYRVLFASAVATLPRPYRKMLGVRRSPLPVVTITRVVLAMSEKALASGPGRRANDHARDRLRRLEAAEG